MKINSDKLILIIDDSLDNRNLLSMLLISKGFQVHCASNGVGALAFLNEFQKAPDLILLDLLMPHMDGWEFRKKQKKINLLKNIPVIVMSGDEHIEDIKNLLEPAEILIKPLDIASILSAISKIL